MPINIKHTILYFIILCAFITVLSIQIVVASDQPEKSTSDLKNGSPGSCNCVAFRLDDVGDYSKTNVLIEIMNVFKEKNANLTIGIIGDELNNQTLISYIKERIKESADNDTVTSNNKSKSLIELANHSWKHEDFTKLKVNEMYNSIRKTNVKINNIFGVKPNLFIVPFTNFTRDIFSPLRENNMLYFSASEENDPSPYNIDLNQTIFHLPQTAYTGRCENCDIKKNGSWFAVPHQKTMDQINRSLDRYGFAVVTLHPYEYSKGHDQSKFQNIIDTKQLNELKMLIDSIRIQGLMIVTMSDIVPNSISNNMYQSPSNCVDYSSITASIYIECKSANLNDVYDYLKKQGKSKENILLKEPSNVWLLNSNLEVENGSTFYVNSTDTSWLKINSTGGLSHYIDARGNLVINSVKITSWDTSKRNYATTDENGTIHRAYILVEKDGGRVNIADSEIGYLGYSNSDSFGLTSYSNADNILKHNKIHDLYYGFKSSENVANDTIDNNEFFNNSKYGMYLQGHDSSVKSNKVYDNGDHGIMCSSNCYNTVLDSNNVFNNSKEGIMFYGNVSNSIIRNNILSNNRDQVALYESSNYNTLNNNTISGGKVGIRISSNSSKNMINLNNITNSIYGIYLLQGASGNEINSNKISNTSNTGILIQDPETNDNIFRNNVLLDNAMHNINEIDQNTTNSIFINNTAGNSSQNKIP